MEKPSKLSLKKEIRREVEQLEKEIENSPELDKIEVSKEMDIRFQEKLRAYEHERAEEETVREEIRRLKKSADEENELGKAAHSRKENHDGEKVVAYRGRKRPKLYIALVAIFIILLGTGMTSVGSKPYWKVLYEKLMGKETVQIINVEDMEKEDSADVDEVAAYQEIEKQFNILAVRLRYKPAGMRLSQYTIDSEQSQIHMFYEYNKEIIKYTIYVNNADSSFGMKEEDKKVDSYEVDVNGMTIEVEEYDVPECSEHRQVADFEYEKVHYQLKGIMEKVEFKKILENLYFL